MQNNTLTPEQLNALIHYAGSEGRFWKRSLNNAWMNGNYGYTHQTYCGYLQQVRNQFGPSWLVSFKLPKS